MDYLDSAINSLNSAMKSIETTFQDLTVEWEKTIEVIKEKAREFIRVFDRLENKRAVINKTPALKNDFDSLINRGSFIKESIERILPNSSAMDAMGVIPLIPIAAVLAAIAAISAWLAPAYVMLQKIDLAEKALAKGLDPGRILEAGESGLIGDVKGAAQQITKAAFVIGGGFILWRYWPVIKKAFK